MSPLECQLDDHRVTGHVHVVELAVHVGKRRPVVLNRLGNFVGPAVGHSNRLVDERSVGVEAGDPSRDVLDLGSCVSLADELFVCHVIPFTLLFVLAHVRSVARAAGVASVPA